MLSVRGKRFPRSSMMSSALLGEPGQAFPKARELRNMQAIYGTNRLSLMGQPGKPRPGNPPRDHPDPDKPPPVEEPPRPIQPPRPDNPPPPMQA